MGQSRANIHTHHNTSLFLWASFGRSERLQKSSNWTHLELSIQSIFLVIPFSKAKSEDRYLFSSLLCVTQPVAQPMLFCISKRARGDFFTVVLHVKNTYNIPSRVFCPSTGIDS